MVDNAHAGPMAQWVSGINIAKSCRVVITISRQWNPAVFCWNSPGCALNMIVRTLQYVFHTVLWHNATSGADSIKHGSTCPPFLQIDKHSVHSENSKEQKWAVFEILVFQIRIW